MGKDITENKMMELAREIAEANGFELVKKKQYVVKEIPIEWKEEFDTSTSELAGKLAALEKQIELEDSKLKEIKTELEEYLKKEPVTPVNDYFMNRNNMQGAIVLNQQNIEVVNGSLEELQEKRQYISEKMKEQQRKELFDRIAASVKDIKSVNESRSITGRKLSVTI